MIAEAVTFFALSAMYHTNFGALGKIGRGLEGLADGSPG
jgi:hypothetical protein